MATPPPPRTVLARRRPGTADPHGATTRTGRHLRRSLRRLCAAVAAAHATSVPF